MPDSPAPQPPVYFVADTHFRDRPGPSEGPRREAFLRFLETVPSGAQLYLLGDIFDFYFEFQSAVPSGYLDLYAALYRLGNRGVQVHFLGGNHDSWTGPFLRDRLGVRVHGENARFRAQGREVLCVHGDLVLPGDWGYKFFKMLTRNPLSVAAARLIHPDLLMFVARKVSAGSKRARKRSHRDLAEHLGDMAFQGFFDQGNDSFVMGHVHHPLHRQQEGKDFLILGDWVEHRSYAVLAGGRISLQSFSD